MPAIVEIIVLLTSLVWVKIVLFAGSVIRVLLLLGTGELIRCIVPRRKVTREIFRLDFSRCFAIPANTLVVVAVGRRVGLHAGGGFVLDSFFLLGLLRLRLGLSRFRCSLGSRCRRLLPHCLFDVQIVLLVGLPLAQEMVQNIRVIPNLAANRKRFQRIRHGARLDDLVHKGVVETALMRRHPDQEYILLLARK